MLATAVTTAAAQSGTATFGGGANGAPPTVGFGAGPALGFTSQILTGFGNQATAGGASALWWSTDYSGQGMLYGNNSTFGNVLEVRLKASSGFDLFLERTLFGGWLNTARHVTHQLFSDDYSLSTSMATMLTGSLTPVTPLFAANGWGNAIRLQFTEADAFGVASGRGAFDVGTQDIGYTVRPTAVAPEPESFVLLAIGMLILGVGMQRRRARQG